VGAIAAAIDLAFASPDLCQAAAEINARLIAQRASRSAIAAEISAFYARLAGRA
jgi:hypothetical protein